MFLLRKITNQGKRLAKNGIIHIIGTSVINKIIGFVLSVIIVRILSKTDYGIYSYAYNIVSMFLLFSGLGIKNGILQYCSDKIGKEDQNSYFKFGFNYGFICNVIIAIAIFVYATFFDLSLPDAKTILQAMTLIPIFNFILEYGQIFLRVKLRNKEYAIVTSVHSVSQAIFVVMGAFLLGVYGYIIGFYISLFITIYYVYIISKKDLSKIKTSEKRTIKHMGEVIKFSIVSVCTNVLSQLLYLLDVFLIGVIITDVLVLASYKASTTIPNALYFITNAIILVIYPYFVRHKSDKRWLKCNIRKVMGGIALINIPIALFMFFGADFIVYIVYGNAYADAVPIFKVLAVGYAFVTLLKIPCGNFLLMMGKVKLNLINAIICGITNIILDIVLIQKYGSIGAAYATVFVMFVSSMISVGFSFYYFLKLKDDCNDFAELSS